MLKPTRMTLSWPRLIGIASGTFGAAVTVATGAAASAAGSLTMLDRPAQFIPLICGCVFLVLAFPLFAGREWARRALLLATYCSVAALAISFSFLVLQRSGLPSAPVYLVFLRIVIGIGALVSVLTPPAFLLAVLHHADVRRAFNTPHI